MADGTRVDDELIVEFEGDERILVPGDELTFGRAGDIVIDESNRFLHRTLGLIAFSSGSWWIVNIGSSIAMRMDDQHSSSYGIVAPGARATLSYDTTSLSFEAGRCSYALRCELLVDRPTFSLQRTGTDGDVDEEETTTATSVPLNDDQRLLLVALCEPWLAVDGNVELPTNRQLAHRLGWSITKFNRKLDWLCVKLAKGGVAGLVASEGELARDRRLRLAEYALHAGIVTADDLAHLG